MWYCFQDNINLSGIISQECMHHFTGSKDPMAVRANKAGETGEQGREQQVPGLQMGKYLCQQLPSLQTIQQDKRCLQIQFYEPGRGFRIKESLIAFDSSQAVCNLSVLKANPNNREQERVGGRGVVQWYQIFKKPLTRCLVFCVFNNIRPISFQKHFPPDWPSCILPFFTIFCYMQKSTYQHCTSSKSIVSCIIPQLL